MQSRRKVRDLLLRMGRPDGLRLPDGWKRGSGAATIIVGAFLLLSVAGCQEKEEAPKPTPPEVEVTTVVQRNVPNFQEWVAQLNGQVNADITPKVQGYLLKRDYTEGFFVHKGQLLYEIDPRPFVAALDQAKATVAVAVAEEGEAENNVNRDTPLAAQHAIPQKQLDTDISNLQATKAQVDAAKAAMVQAELNLSWTKVYSPIDGVAGLSNSNVGDLVGVTTKMTTVSQVDPIRAYFNISESQYLSNAAAISRTVRGDRTAANAYRVRFIQTNGVEFPAVGKIVLVNRQVASSTGTIQLAAEFPNKDGYLRPGGFGSIRIETGMSQNALLVPQPAVIEVQSQYQVIVLTPENKAVFRPVKVGDRVGPDWIVTEGLKPGEKVVVEGIQRVQMTAAAAPAMAKEGVPVVAKPYIPAPAALGGN
jgi:membrane fusion protein (multidrug efflux system)